MKRIHKDIEAIVDFINQEGMSLTKIKRDGALSLTSNLTDLKLYMDESHHLLGDRPDFYFMVTRKNDYRCMNLERAVTHVENNSMDFLLIAHSDGGIISISGHQLPFQSNSELADWWRP